MRVARDMVRQQADDVEEFRDALVDFGRGKLGVDAQRLGDEIADAAARIERGRGILEHHLKAAAQRPHLAQRFAGDVVALKEQLAAGDVVKPDETARERRLSAAGFADEPERFAAPHRQRDIVDGVHGPPALRRKAGADGKPLHQRAGFEDRAFCRRHRVAHACVSRRQAAAWGPSPRAGFSAMQAS